MPSSTRDYVPRLQRLIPRLRGKRVGVLGDLMLDRYLWGTASRLSPEAAVPIVDFEEESDRLGGAGNVAANLAALGASVQCFGVIGNDQAGNSLRACLRGEGIAGQGVLVDKDRLTTLKTRILARHQQIVRIDRETADPIGNEIEGHILRTLNTKLKKMNALVLSDYDKGLINDDFAERVLRACDRSGVPVFVKPKKSRLYAYRGARAIVCNAAEAGFFAGRPLTDEKSVDEVAGLLLARFGCAAVLITRGPKGMSLREESSRHSIHIPATGVEVSYARIGEPGIEKDATGRQVFDVTGAGDTVLSALALAAASGASIYESALIANAAAGVVVSKLGTATVQPQELANALKDLR
jgi:D-beta-D-heptose 7-phosphate kinase/D-beta-D-heptose 1-phosphate adenosyltransferase